MDVAPASTAAVPVDDMTATGGPLAPIAVYNNSINPCELFHVKGDYSGGLTCPPQISLLGGPSLSPRVRNDSTTQEGTEKHSVKHVQLNPEKPCH